MWEKMSVLSISNRVFHMGMQKQKNVRAGILIHTLELKLWHFSHTFVCESRAFAMFPAHFTYVCVI